MSNDDQYGGGGGEVGGTGQTRTRLPESPSDTYGTPRRSRGLVTVVGVVVLLIAAIAFANQSSDSPPQSSSDKPPAATNPTAVTGVPPVDTKSSGIPKGFPQTEQGAQSAAANYAVALGSDGMFRKNSRHTLVDGVYTPDAAARLKGPQDEAYSAAFLARLGLDANGNPPQGNTFVTRAVPVGTRLDGYSPTSAKVAVWYTGLIGMSGAKSTDPVRTSWKTWIFELVWTGGDWKVLSDTQQDGPAPVPGDAAASTSDDISKAIKEFGGFTYAR